MPDTRLDNRDLKPYIANTEEIYTAHGEQMAQIRESIANML